MEDKLEELAQWIADHINPFLFWFDWHARTKMEVKREHRNWSIFANFGAPTMAGLSILLFFNIGPRPKKFVSEIMDRSWTIYAELYFLPGRDKTDDCRSEAPRQPRTAHWLDLCNLSWHPLALDPWRGDLDPLRTSHFEPGTVSSAWSINQKREKKSMITSHCLMVSFVYLILNTRRHATSYSLATTLASSSAQQALNCNRNSISDRVADFSDYVAKKTSKEPLEIWLII